MKTILEKNYRISHNEDRFTQEYPFHSHDFYEIYFFAGGSVTYYIESKSYHLSERDILMKRINLAKDYLESGFSPTSIYEKCGFSTYSNFYKAFTGQTGISPGNYKR